MEERKVVLIVEDEEYIRLIAVETARDAGYEPIEAANADVAIEILERRNDIDIVFTDIDMPGSMDGVKLAYTIRDCWPSVELILTSGAFLPRRGSLPGRSAFLGKPYSLNQLTNALRRAAGLSGR